MTNFTRTSFLISYKLVIALLALSAVINEIATLVKSGSFVPQNFFSLFTIQTNLFAIVMLVIGAYALIRGTKSGLISSLRGAATLYMIITGIIFILLLSGLTSGNFVMAPWDDTVMHYVIPVAMILDWLLDAPQTRLRKRTVALWLVYPLLYVVYTLVRGAITDWYPYPFLDPIGQGYGPIIMTCVAITVGVVFGGFIIRYRSTVGTRN